MNNQDIIVYLNSITGKKTKQDYSKFNINVYVFSLGNDDHSEEFFEFGGKVSSVAIPKALMNAYSRAQRMIGGAK